MVPGGSDHLLVGVGIDLEKNTSRKALRFCFAEPTSQYRADRKPNHVSSLFSVAATVARPPPTEVWPGLAVPSRAPV